jgi:hypothetical protein
MKQDFIRANPMIIQALGEVMDRRVEQIPVEKHTFSPAFEQKMDRLIRAQSKPYYRFTNTKPKRAMLALAAAFVLMLTLMFSVSALRVPVVRFIVEVYERFSAVFFHSGAEERTPPATLEVIYEPAWLPEGFALDKEMTTASDSVRTSYFTKDNEIIVCRQYTFLTGLALDTEGVEIRSAEVHGQDAILYRNKGLWMLVWNDNQYGFALSGPVDTADLLRIAESLREK